MNNGISNIFSDTSIGMKIYIKVHIYKLHFTLLKIC